MVITWIIAWSDLLTNLTINKKNDKPFNNRGYSLFFLMGFFKGIIDLSEASVIDPNISKWQNSKVFTKLAPSQNSFRSSHRRCSVKKDILKNLQNLTGKHLCIKKRLQHRYFPVKFMQFSKGNLRSETIFDNWKPFKNDPKCFLFHLNSFLCSQDT